MINLKDKEKCCGCTACYSVCPKRAIVMKADEEGFLYPCIDKNKCISCGLCEKVCPVENKKAPEKDLPDAAYVVRNTNFDVLSESASGGFFTALAEYVISVNGYVYGAAYDNNLKVLHVVTCNSDEIKKFRSSKYVQSDLNDCFTEIKKLLELGNTVCFSGTPCQVEGLKLFLGKEYSNLITVDLICHGVPSPLLWEKYIELQNRKKKSTLKDANFRNKDYGYHGSTLKLRFENGKSYHGSSRNDIMMKCFFGEISSRPSCYHCAFKYAKHRSDFTIFDCWHVSQITGYPDDDKGYTHLFVQSEKGMEILQSLKSKLDIFKSDAEEAIRLDGPMVRKSTKPHKNREYFLASINDIGLEAAVNKYIPLSEKDKLVVSTKSFLYRIGLLKKAQNLAKKLHI